MTQMVIPILLFFSFFALQLVSSISSTLPLAPALYVFGDSLLDSGNNNYLPTLAKANYLPYGADFSQGSTGRFTNGRTVADFIAEYLGLPYSPPYLSFEGKNSLSGINYASSSCGILPETGINLGKCLNLRDQVNLFQLTIERHLSKRLRNTPQLYEHLTKSLYVISIGSNDYINNYLQTTFYDTSKHYAPRPFAELLIEKLSQQLERLYKLGARKIITFEIGPVGCMPSLSRKHKHIGDCMEEANQIVSYFNDGLHAMVKNLTSNLPSSIFVIGQVNSLANDVIRHPSKYGVKDGKSACCTTWQNGTSGCIPLSKPCLNSNKHVFWDAYHLTESAYSIISSRCLNDTSVCTPVSIQEIVKM